MAAGTPGDDVRVSVLITSYDHEAFIGQAIEGVLEQRGVGPIELVVGDDCSSDGTRAVIEGYARRHPGRVVPFFPERNMGGGGKALYAELVRRSRGRFIAGMDGDDYWTSPDKLATQLDHLDRTPGCTMVFHNAVRRTDDGSVPDALYNPPDQARTIPYADWFEQNPVASCTPVFRREVLDPLPPWYLELPWGDLPLYLLAAAEGEVHYLPDVMGVYRLHGGGMFSGLSALRQETLDVEFFRGLSGVVPPQHDRYRRRRLAVAEARLAHQLALTGDHQAAADHLAESFRTWPLDVPRLRPGRGELRRVALWLDLHTRSRGRWSRDGGAAR
ncbi:glycosyltransferase [Modestobacter versicolor]|uniref:glycosyltransferase n=1 Tax=Modestobacter versicolor TaxID=429133 RepID=UPI0034DEC528